MIGLLRQSVYSRLGGYEDTNDAEGLRKDPGMRAVIGDRALEKAGAGETTIGRFEKEKERHIMKINKMAHLSILSMFLVLFFGGYNPVTCVENLSVSFLTTASGGGYAPENVVGIWIEDNSGNFVKTVGRWANTLATSLVDWTTKSGGKAVDTDGVSGATRSNHTATLTVNWNMTNKSSVVVANGVYKIQLESNDHNPPTMGNRTTFTFNKNGTDSTQNTSGGGFNSVQIVYTGPSADTTPPSTPAIVRDGTNADISSTLSTTQLSANWDASTDGQSGVSGYKYAIGTTAGGTSITNWTTLGNVTAVTKIGLVLTVGTTYYFSVKAINGVSLEGTATNSNGQRVASNTDTTPPSAPAAVRDGTGSDIGSTSLTTQLSANWTASTDPESGISKYWYAIGSSSQGATNTVNWSSTTAISVTRAGLSLTIGTTYYFTVKAENGAGLQSPRANSNGQYVGGIYTGDTTPPGYVPVVRDGTSYLTGINYTTSAGQLSANWDDAIDIESDIARYLYAIGTTPGSSSILGWTDNGTATNVTQMGLTLIIGTTYYFSVKAVNRVGLESTLTAVSNGQYVAANVQSQSIPQPVKIYPNPNKLSGNDPVRFLVTQNTNNGLVVNIYTSSGKLTRKIKAEPGINIINWDGKNDDGEHVVKGVYLYSVTDSWGGKIQSGKIAVVK